MFGVVDAALELLGALNSGPASSAVVAGWAAMEALLNGPTDSDILAADRMASLVACAFVRAELTYLSYQVQKAGGALAATLAGCATNRERSLVLASAVTGGQAICDL